MAQTTINSISQMRSSIETVNGYIAEYKTQIAQLMTIVDDIDANWDDNASEQFVTKFRADQTKFDALEAMLKEYMLRLEEIVKEYETAEARALEIVNAVKM